MDVSAIKEKILTSDSPTAMGACVFAGGFSFGMEEAGFDVVGHFENPDLNVGLTVANRRWPVAVGYFEEWMQHGRV